MARFLISEEQELYKEFQEEFSTPVDVALYKRKISSKLFIGTLSRTVDKKPVVYFYNSSTKNEISKRDWTPEMKSAATQYAKKYPVPNAGKKFTLLGKSFIFLTIGGILAAIIGVSYGILFKAPKLKNNVEQFTALPKVGDKFYGLINQTTSPTKAPKLEYGWIKITNVSPADSICTYVLSNNLGEVTFNALEEADHEKFNTESYFGKFKSNKEKQFISLISKDKNDRFESRVLNNDTKNYKISAE